MEISYNRSSMKDESIIMSDDTTMEQNNQHHRPWQYDWKRPQWHSKQDDDDDEEETDQRKCSRNVSHDTKNRPPLDHTAAAIRESELGRIQSSSDTRHGEDGVGGGEQEGDASSFILTATLLAEDKNKEFADVVLLEVIKQEQQQQPRATSDGTDSTRMEKIHSRVLRWPESALRQEKESRELVERNPFLLPWIRGVAITATTSMQTAAASDDGCSLVSVCLCRLPPPDPTAALTDALDIVHLLSLGNTMGLTPTQREWLHHLKAAPPGSAEEQDEETSTRSITSNSNDDNDTDLVLVCLSSQGKVYVYSPWELLGNDDSGAADDPGEHMDNGMASLLLGDVWADLRASFLPLTKPIATLSLTVPLLKKRKQKNNRPTEEQTSTETQPHHPTSSHEGGGFDILDSSMWNPSTDTASFVFRTKDNVPKLVVSALDCLCIAGTGRRVKRNNMQQRFSSSGTISDGIVMARTTNDIGNTCAAGPCPQIKLFSQLGGGVDAGAARGLLTPPTTLEAGDYQQQQQQQRGGFVTFLSLRTYSEIRTVYLPFEPVNISPFVWGGMTFLFVMGKENYVAIRMDSSQVDTVRQDEAPSLFINNSDEDDSVVAGSGGGGAREKPEIVVRRFQILPLLVPELDDSQIVPSLVVGSSSFTSPPSMALLMLDNIRGQLSAVERSLEAVCQVPMDIEDGVIDPLFAGYQSPGSKRGYMTVIRTDPKLGHEATMPLSATEVVSPRDLWCHLGQGWCLVAAKGKVFFVCFEGATSAIGAFCQEITGEEAMTPTDEGYGQATAILPINPFRIASADDFENLDLPFSGPLKKTLFAQEIVDIGGNTQGEEDPQSDALDDLVVNAMESISSFTFSRNATAPSSSPVSPGGRRSTSFSHQEKSTRLLRQCSSWMHLEQSVEARSRFSLNQPVISFQAKGLSSTLSLRRTVIENGVATPFHHVLAWLCDDQGDFFTAASLALDLLRDGSSLRHLWMAFEKIDVTDDASKLEGLLDGIIPILGGTEGKGPTVKSTLTQLANMTVGCLTKGGFAMAGTLEHFLSHDRHYDPSRASLMLVAAVACTLSDDEDIVTKCMGGSYQKTDNHGLNIMWPVRCLLQVGVARDTLATALLLLNVTVPDELRRRKRSAMAASPRPSMEMCKTLVSLIVASSPQAAELLLGLVDEQSRVPYWESLDHETQLELALVGINDRYPMLRQPEIRAWTLQQLQECLHAEESATSIHVYENTPSPWLQQLTVASLCNGGCDLDGLRRDILVCENSDRDDTAALEEYQAQILRVQRALVCSPGSGGVDFDIVIDALLILHLRGEIWREESDVPSQSLLNGACFVAGRRGNEEPLFALDEANLMSQCFLAGNVQAGANLVGGQNGFVLECCDILIRDACMEMGEAEEFLLSDSMPAKDSRPALSDDSAGTQFKINQGHLHALWLFEQHVLNIQKYGDFSSAARGKVDAVFAARLCLRTWWRLSCKDAALATGSTSWLVDWLRNRLEMSDEAASPHRLACSALIRALIYSSSNSDREPNDDKDLFLAAYLNIPNSFLVQLAQSCCGLVEAIQLNASDEAGMLRKFYDDETNRRSRSTRADDVITSRVINL